MSRFVLIACALIGAPVAADAAAAPASDRLVLPSIVIPTHYDLDVTLDSADKAFTGRAKIDVTVNQPTRQIVLNAADLEFQSVTLSAAGSPAGLSFDRERQTVTLDFPADVSKGRHVLTIEYTGKVNQSAAGLFALEYDGAQGKKRALFTQFENSDARRFFPCWDEPARKATFTLAATLPAAEMAVSNMPIVATDTLPNGLRHVHFATTPKMSSYLLFFGAGDFERVARTVNGIDVGIIVKRGDGPKASYALDAAAQILPYYEDYFGVKFPLPKLDLIGGPGRSQFFGAMENWGAIFYFERYLENDPVLSTESDRRNVYEVVAHEMAHQWFGDLVTMQWWDEIWLNEGFASWMASKVTDHFHPDWQIPLSTIRSKERAMVLDARAGTHPIIQPIRDVLQANQAFDTITYSKGEAVIGMLESYVGADSFRAGVRQYIRKHAYGNTVTDDLWAELDKTAPEPVSGIAHDFTLQAGVPLVRVLDEAGKISLQQERFAADASGEQPTSWRVPVLERALGSNASWRGIVTRAQAVSIDKGSDTTFVVNVSQAGYFRTLYASELLRPLVTRFGGLVPENQAGLLNDTSALGYSGLEPLTDFLEVAQRTTPDMNVSVLRLVTDKLRDLDQRFDGLPGQMRFREYARRVLSPVFAKVGWTADPAESPNTRLLRASLLSALSQFGDAQVVSEARTRFAALLADPKSLSAEVRHSVLAVVAENADAATWEQLRGMAKRAGSNLEKEELYGLLGAAQDPELAQRALQLSLTEEVAVTMRPELIREVANGHFPDLAFEFVSTHFEQVNDMLEPDSRNQFAPALLQHSGNAAMIPRLRAFAEAHIPASARRDAIVAEAAVAYNVRIRSMQLPEIEQWLTTTTARN